ncbi:MAG: PQQ-binding-like beta-propeller repeat protein [Pirellulaceae bacterium]|nr:PQQ-binding-like beta-propeller repeat protein [Pirellulaceae bacterium]
MTSETRTILIRRAGSVLLLSIFLTSTSTAFSQTVAPPVEPRDANPRILVGALGSDSFPTRQWAEYALRRMDAAARDALFEGLGSNDLQTRRTCRRLLDAVGPLDTTREAAFLSGRPERDATDLPGWSRFKQAVGDDLAARKFYLSMLRAESALLASFALDPESAATALRLRCGQLAVHRGGKQSQPSRASLAAIMLVGADRASRSSPTTRHHLNRVLARWLPEKNDPNHAMPLANDPSMRLLGHFIALERDELLIPNCFQLVMTLPVKDSALHLAQAVIEARDDYRPETVAMAAGIAGWSGGEDYLAALVGLLDDERPIGGARGRNNSIVLEVRDVAAAWIVHLSRRNVADQGINCGDYFRRVAERRDVRELGRRGPSFFADKASRDAALDRLQAWLAEYPPKPLAHRPPAKQEDGANGDRRSGPEVSRTSDAADLSVRSLALADYLQASRFHEARDFTSAGRFIEGTAVLGGILVSRDDWLFAADAGRHRGLRSAAESVLASLPATGLSAYEQRFGEEARRRLDAAVESRDGSLLGDVQNGYFFTSAGAQAAFLRAMWHLDRDEPRMALLYLRRLDQRGGLEPALRESVWLFQAVCALRVGDEDLARRTLEAWQRQDPRASVKIEGRPTSLFSDEQSALDRLRRVVGGGEAAGPSTSPTNATPPRMLDMAGTEYPILARLLRQIVADRQKQGRATLSTVDTLRVGDRLIQRVLTGIAAVDEAGGNLAWHVPSENALSDSLRHGSPAEGQQVVGTIKALLGNRLWRDASWGSLTTDGTRIFALEDLAFDLSAHYQHLVTRMDGRREWNFGVHPGPNLLSAYDVRTGKIVWQVGTAFGETTPGFSGARLLGPPLPLGNQLFVLVYFPDQTRIVQLDASNGHVVQQWPVTPVHQDATEGPDGSQPAPDARQGSLPVELAPPVFSGDRIVCAVSRNQFVALDPCAGLAWSVQIESPPPEPRGRPNRARAARAAAAWMRAEAVVAGNRVLATSPADERLHCLDLETGEPLWRTPCRGGLLVATALGDRVLVVGESRVFCLTLDDGQSAWPAERGVLPKGAVPLHRGWVYGKNYLLPLNTAQFAVVDLATGIVRMNITAKNPKSRETIDHGPGGTARVARAQYGGPGSWSCGPGS